MFKILLNICLLFFIVNSYAQQTTFKPFNIENNFNSKTAPLLFTNNINFCQPLYSTKNLYPKTNLPLFCQMEVNLHKHLNIWMVFRAGNDEEYRKFIVK